jgi:glycosyltransferase involved in cell wall biosynthesis
VTQTPSTKKRVLIAHPYVSASGGGNAVAAWALQALREEFHLELATLGPIDFAAVNRSFGTSLRPGDFPVHLAPTSTRYALRCMPTPGALLERSLTIRLALDLDRAAPYDVLFSTQNECDFLRPGIQYVHFPAFYLPRPEIELSWYHKLPGMLDAYRAVCRRLERGSPEGVLRNLTLANSQFVAERIRERHGIGSLVLHPPVPGDFPDTPWADREAAFVALGRIHPTKRWHWTVEIVEELRRRGHPVSLTLIGHQDDRDYSRALWRLQATRPWFRMLHDLNRQQLAETVARHRYGLHTMEDEHFGIAPAELQRAGCVTFVHNSGGPVEIVGGESSLTFDDPAGAVEKIDRMLRDPDLELRLRGHVAAQRERYSVETFCRRLRTLVRDFQPAAEGRSALSNAPT